MFLPFWFIQLGVIAVSTGLLVELFGAVSLAEAVTAALCVSVIYGAVMALYRVYGPEKVDEELEEFLTEIGLGDDPPVLTDMDALRNLLVATVALAALIWTLGLTLFFQVSLAGICLAAIYHAYEGLMMYLSVVWFSPSEEEEEVHEPEEPDYVGAASAGFEDFDPKGY